MNKLLLLFLIFFGILSIISASMVIISKNPVHSVLFLVLVCICIAVLFFLLQVEFIAILVLMIYLGAIIVLFLFVVMMLNIKISELNETIIRYLPIGFILGLIFFFELLVLLNIDLSFINFSDYVLLETNNLIPKTFYIDWYLLLESATNIEVLGILLYNYYFMYYIIASLILLLAMVGCIILTLNFIPNIKVQKDTDQIYFINKINLIKYNKK
jgi:NADH-quinone oxidoreductase subunit J